MGPYDNWKEGEPLVINVFLDPLNPRIPGSGKHLSQREVMADLVENDKVYELARSIADNGYYPIEALIVVRERRKTYVLEGNRRLAALKLLLNSEAAPEEWQARFRSLAGSVGASGATTKVKVIRAPTRDAAQRMVMTRHTAGQQIAKWSPAMQAKWYANLRDSGLTAQDIASHYKLRLADVGDALRMHEMYTCACALQVPEDVARKVHNPRNFEMSTIERLYKYPRGRDFLGISFDDNGHLVGNVQQEEFKKAYTKIITDVARHLKRSRDLNSTEDMDKYFAEFGEQAPDLKKRGHFTLHDILDEAKERAKVAPKKTRAATTPAKRRKQLALIPKSFRCNVRNQRIAKVCEELQGLQVAKFPNAVAILFRSLLEMSLGYYLERTGHMKGIRAAEREKQNRGSHRLPPDWQPALRDMLKYISRHGEIIAGNALKAVKALVDEKDPLFSVKYLNFFVHNEYMPPEEKPLRRFWAQLEELFVIMLAKTEWEE